MKKNKISILGVICIFIFIMQIANASHDFTDLSTIKTWVADKYCNDVNLMEKIRILVSETVFTKNKTKQDFDKIFKDVPQDKNVKIYAFGKTFPTIMAAELPFLQHVKEISKNKEVVTLEIAAARGYVSWKIPLAFENSGTHYANDFSSTVIKEELEPRLKKNFNKLRIPGMLNSIKTIEGSCFDILKMHPELKNKVDVIYVQNLEHFLNPKQHIEFIRLIEKLLAPNGKAFLCAHSPSALEGSMDDRTKKEYHKLVSVKAETNSLRPAEELLAPNGEALLCAQSSSVLEDAVDDRMKKKCPNSATVKAEKNSLYPAFIRYDMEFSLNIGSAVKEEPKFSNMEVLKDYAIEVAGTTLKDEADSYGRQHVVQRLIGNYFTPQMYREIISITTDLELEDAFYGSGVTSRAPVQRMDCENWSDCNGSSFTIAVVRKPEGWIDLRTK